MNFQPHVTVAAVVCNARGEHLLVEEAPNGEPVFNQPAGHVEHGESALDAIVREMREETCRAFTPTALLGVYKWIAPNQHTYVRLCFLGEVGEALTGCELDPDIHATHWLAPDKLGTPGFTPRSPLVGQCIADFQAGIRYPLEVIREIA